jgi:uncharacterized membrane protein
MQTRAGACLPMRRTSVLVFGAMEINQIKRFIKELEDRTSSLRGYL